MPSVARFPDETYGGPRCLKVVPVTPLYAAKSLIFEDGSASFNLHGPCAVEGWILTYAGLTPVEAATLDAHYNSARKAYEFWFYDRNTKRIYDHVFYKDYKVVKHTRYWNTVGRQIELVRFP